MKLSAFTLLTVLALGSSCNNVSDLPTTAVTTTEPTLEEAKPAIETIEDDSTRRVLYLTFDDGPMRGTSTVLNILENHKAPATFFLIGLHAAHMPGAKQDMARLRSNTLFELCNHSYTHAYRNSFDKFYLDTLGAVADFQRAQDSLNFPNNILRTPGNNMWRTDKYVQNTMKRYVPASKALHNHGFRLAGWDVEWHNYKQQLKQSAESLKKEIDASFAQSLNKAQGHCVLLMHDAAFHDPKDSASLAQFIVLVQADTLYRMSVISKHPFFRN